MLVAVIHIVCKQFFPKKLYFLPPDTHTYIVSETWTTRWCSKFCPWQFHFTSSKIVLTKPSRVLMVNVRKPFMKHIWFGVVFNSKHEYEKLVKVDLINIQNFQLLHLFSCSSDSVTIILINCLFLTWSGFFEICFMCTSPG